MRSIVQKGPIIGKYESQPIYKFLVYDDNLIIRFFRVATVGRDGAISLLQLSDDEVVVSPGLVYQRENATSHI
jgi:hypothetical protein